MTVTTLRKPDASASTLEARIAQALSADTASAVLSALLPEIQDAARDTKAKLEAASARALDPLLGGVAAHDAREEAGEHQFRFERLTASQSAVRSAFATAQERERKARHDQLWGEAKAERDALMAELKDRYPKIAAELANLLRRIEANNARTLSVGLDPVESVARGIEGYRLAQANEYVPLIRGVALPSFRTGKWIWNARLAPDARAEA